MKSELVPMTTTAPVDPGHIFDDNTILCSQTYCLVQAGFEQSRGDLGSLEVLRNQAPCLDELPVQGESG